MLFNCTMSWFYELFKPVCTKDTSTGNNQFTITYILHLMITLFFNCYKNRMILTSKPMIMLYFFSAILFSWKFLRNFHVLVFYCVCLSEDGQLIVLHKRICLAVCYYWELSKSVLSDLFRFLLLESVSGSNHKRIVNLVKGPVIPRSFRCLFYVLFT